MAALNYSFLSEGLLMAIPAVIYTCPAGKTALIRAIMLTNASGTNKTVSITVNLSGTDRPVLTAGNVGGNPAVLQKETRGFFQLIPLTAGQYLSASCETDSVVTWLVLGSEELLPV